MKKKLDLTKPMQTRDGRKVLWFALVPPELQMFYSLCVVTEGKKYDPEAYTTEGRYLGDEESDEDLINTPETVTLYINVYRNSPTGPFYCTTLYTTEERAAECALRDECFIGTFPFHIEL